MKAGVILIANGCAIVWYHVYDKDLAAGSLQSCLCTAHGMYSSGLILVGPVCSLYIQTHFCSLAETLLTDGALSRGRTCNAALLRRHFFNQHPTAHLHLEEYRNVPCFCTLCGVLILLLSIQRSHVGSKSCKTNIHYFQQRACKQAAVQAQAQVFTFDGDKVKKVENFKYLGHQISSKDSDFPALFLNLSKASRKHLTRISRLFTRDRDSPSVSRRFYDAAIMLMLLCRLEIWVLSTHTYA